MPPLIAPSLLAADFSNLTEAARIVNESQADWFHLDVMDGQFVPNFTFGMLLVEAFHRIAQKPLDVHLMMVEPERHLEAFSKAGANVLTVHYEACPHLHRTVQQIHELGAKAGVALNPHTPVSVLEHLLGDIDLVCLMSVNPGFGGQKFIPSTLTKIRQLREMIAQSNTQVLIEIDGGVNLDNAAAIVAAGADVLVAGNAIFHTPDPVQTIAKFSGIAVEAFDY